MPATERGEICVSQNGLENLSNRAICEGVGVTPSTLYHYFADQTALLDALVDWSLADFYSSVSNTKPVNAVEDHRMRWRLFLEFARTRPEHFKILLSAILSNKPINSLEQIYRALRLSLTRIDAEFGLNLTPELASQMTIAQLIGLATLSLSKSDFNWTDEMNIDVFDRLLSASCQKEQTLLRTCRRGKAPASRDITVSVSSWRANGGYLTILLILEFFDFEPILDRLGQF